MSDDDYGSPLSPGEAIFIRRVFTFVAAVWLGGLLTVLLWGMK